MHAVRPAAVAGLFYPDDPTTLARTVDGLLERALPPPHADGEWPKLVVAPHAGYAYSGAVAASAYATLAGAPIERIVLLGPAHRVFVHGVAHPEVDALATPLGEMAIDGDALTGAGIRGVRRAHAGEHSLEVQLPFLQRLFPRARVIPVLVGDADPSYVADLLGALWGGDETVIVLSSDLSHFLPYDKARQIDADTCSHLAALDPTPLGGDQACGAHVLNGLTRVAERRRLRATLLDLRNSGDTAGDRRRVVGYAALAVHEA
jgi:AmmeMemoRadiSam system protein B